MTDADVGETIRIVVADGDVADGVNHVIANAAVAFQLPAAPLTLCWEMDARPNQLILLLIHLSCVINELSKK